MSEKFSERKTAAFVFAAFLIAAALAPHASVSAQEESCRHCGMKRSAYGHSWVVFERGGNEATGFCSVHCAALDMALKIDEPIERITVGDYDTRKRIEAEKAFWVVGGDLPGVMTSRAKWAFETEAAAERFVMGHGGRLATFSEAMKAAFEDMYEDMSSIREKRRMRRSGPDREKQ